MSAGMTQAEREVDPWFGEQEVRIQESVAEARRLRAEQNRQFDPGFLYVIEFDSGVVKVGKARSAASRLDAHSKTGLVRSTWNSRRHLWISKTERKLIYFCGENGTLHGGREYFRDISFAAAQDCARQIVQAALDRLADEAGDDWPELEAALVRRTA